MTQIQLWKLVGSLYTKLEQFALPEEFLSIDALSGTLPSGVYTTFRSYYQFKTYPIQSHISRLENSARLKGVEFQLNPTALQSALHTIVYQFPAHEKRLRITVDLDKPTFDIYISIEELKTPSSDEYASGAVAISKEFERNNPEAKSTSFLADALAIKKLFPSEVNEVLLVDQEGKIKEGLSSNFFLIVNGKLITAGEEVLPGITRSIILEAANTAGVPVLLESPSYNLIHDCEEAFISSASRSILPLRKIDSIEIGEHVPGKITKLLTKCFWERIERETVYF